MNLVANPQIKNELDRCNATRMKLELLHNNKDIMVAKYGETEYNNRITDLIHRLLEGSTTVNNYNSSIGNDNEWNTYESA